MTKEKMAYKEHTRKEIENNREALEPIMAKGEIKFAENCKFTAAILPDAERFMVCLLENSKLAPSNRPKVHATRESAENEAERLCKLCHQEFVVLQVVSAFKPQEPKKDVFA